MTTQIATTLKCGSCLNKVRPQLDAFEGMHSWRADLNDPRKLLFVDLAPETDPGRVVELIRDQGFEANIVEEASHASAHQDTAAEESPFRLSTYKPLFLVVTYVLGASLLMLRAAGTWHLSMGMTDDFEIAIEEGATMIRVGRALFGDRRSLEKK